jgi:hypothetical protein
VPTEVKEEVTTPEPNVLFDNTVVPLIENTFAAARSIFSEDVHESVASTQLNVLSVSPRTVIPAPSEAASDGDAVFARTIFLSSTTRVAVFKVVVLPCTIRSPVTVNVSAIVTFEARPRVTDPFEADTVTSLFVPVKLTTPELVTVNVPPSTPVFDTDMPVPAATDST